MKKLLTLWLQESVCIKYRLSGKKNTKFNFRYGCFKKIRLFEFVRILITFEELNKLKATQSKLASNDLKYKLIVNGTFFLQNCPEGY